VIESQANLFSCSTSDSEHFIFSSSDFCSYIKNRYCTVLCGAALCVRSCAVK